MTHQPGDIIHLVKCIKHHTGDGVIVTEDLIKTTHVTVMILGTSDHKPTPAELAQMLIDRGIS
jgi:hypothetical protein